MNTTLIIGGARSGKSALALRLAAASDRPVLFLATMEARDDELRHRVRAHQDERPARWRTIEAPLRPVEAIIGAAQSEDFVILDCVTLWVSNVLVRELPEDATAEPLRLRELASCLVGEVARLDEWAQTSGCELAVVTNETGMGVVPAYPLGRAFRDMLGAVNAELARRFSHVLSVTAGLAFDLKAAGARPIDDFGKAP
jgi:adenosylcobinamide kinase/adenosylcobinamide-phosphate guanylyltransferase